MNRGETVIAAHPTFTNKLKSRWRWPCTASQN